mmetsp:Transcript_6004/g.11911  ORF Transcript_6004/g.11911 Transcript_6004/m.11911 type:complete len:219 (+) Transcript_6004:2079-2735(+)
MERLERERRRVREGDAAYGDAALDAGQRIAFWGEGVAQGLVVEALEELLGGVGRRVGIGGHHRHAGRHHHHHEHRHDRHHDQVHEQKRVVRDAARRISLNLQAEEVAPRSQPQPIIQLHAKDRKDASHRHAIEQAAADRPWAALGGDGVDLGRVVLVELRLRVERLHGANAEHHLADDGASRLLLALVLVLLALLALVHGHHARHRDAHQNTRDGQAA